MSHHWNQGHWDPPATILVVDDSGLNRKLLTASLAREDYRFLEASHGREATEILGRHPEVDLILLDLMMPVMDGFAFLIWRMDNPEARGVPVIVNSSLDDRESLTKALAMDCYDYFIKPLSSADLDLVLPLKIRNAVHSKRLMADLRAKNQIMAGELELAARYQQFLLPKDAQLPGLQAAWLFRPCRGVGGDYFDFFELPGGDLGLVVADVSGHGVASAMTASILKALVPRYLGAHESPAAVLEMLNEDLLRLTPADAFVTCFLGRYDPRERLLRWSLAGHPSPLLQDPDGSISHLEQSSPFLGVFSNDQPLLQYLDKELRLAGGQRLVIHTDGLLEVPDPQGKPMGPGRLKQLLEQHRALTAGQLAEQLAHELDQCDGDHLPDDVALIILDF
ncbi:MAG: fused response regulator/phosphatase [Proteobacteria bacterium]|nr:fused response regulator/phosphatase [Pseudomonadota bacterium]MBU1450968.1 fused response regulator/phosphatase [Pseudomonadota bacterium]MBU2470439.1 fused response regulator/phosphatase [Pseudomonadota bacterium]MBU2517435.1 fused response regulator/phosphatase [Pseudomonadota bacterium]